MSPEPIFISAQPKLLYYAWQLEVMIFNFVESGVTPGSIVVLLAVSEDPNNATNSRDTRDIFDRLRVRFPSVRFCEYADTRPESTAYVSSVRPHLIAKHLDANPWMCRKPVFYHDCDIIFTARPDFSPLIGDDVCYVSDAGSYLGANYIIGKGRDLYEGMCGVVGIDPTLPVLNNASSGGAQYILKGTTPEFWRKVESDCIRMYDYLSLEESRRTSADPSYHPVQKWTADMWCLLWNLWLSGKEVRTHPSLRFCWATDPIDAVSAPILHNAGVTGPGRHFYKQEYTDRLPYGETRSFETGFCSHYYFSQVKKFGEISCLR
jgi:hypothetical protein